MLPPSTSTSSTFGTITATTATAISTSGRRNVFINVRKELAELIKLGVDDVSTFEKKLGQIIHARSNLNQAEKDKVDLGLKEIATILILFGKIDYAKMVLSDKSGQSEITRDPNANLHYQFLINNKNIDFADAGNNFREEASKSNHVMAKFFVASILNQNKHRIREAEWYLKQGVQAYKDNRSEYASDAIEVCLSLPDFRHYLSRSASSALYLDALGYI